MATTQLTDRQAQIAAGHIRRADRGTCRRCARPWPCPPSTGRTGTAMPLDWLAQILDSRAGRR